MSRSWGIVLGAGPGLGRSLALLMARRGLAVAIAGRDESRLSRLADELTAVTGDTTAVTVLPLDAAEPAAVRDAVASLADRVELSCLAYNAVAAGGPLLSVSAEQLATSIAVNALSAVAAVGAAADSLAANAGSVLITGGGLAVHPSSAAGVLSLGKAALRTVSLLLAEELQPRGVTVRTLIVAGAIGATAAFAPDVIAEAFWQTRDQQDVESVYRG